MNNLTAEERLDKIIECKRIIRNADGDIRAYQAEVDEAENRLINCMKRRDEVKLELGTITEIINAMPTARYKEMLKRHYIDGWTWESIAETINCSIAQIYKSRPLAVKEFEDKWNEKTK